MRAGTRAFAAEGKRRQEVTRREVAASNLLVMGSDIDLAEARSFQNAAQTVGDSEREWAGRIRVVSPLRWYAPTWP